MTTTFSVYNETYTYDPTVTTYTLAFGTVTSIDAISGEVGGQSHSFLNNTDFTQVGNSIQWLPNGSKPDTGTTFYVSYTYRRLLGDIVNDMYTRAVSAFPSISQQDGSFVKTLFENVAFELESVYTRLNYIHDTAFVGTSFGSYLDRIAELLGVTRVQPAQAAGTVTFSSNTVAPADIPIPVGTQLSTVPTTGQPTVYFETTAPGKIAQGTSTVDIAVNELYGGVIGNVPPNTITQVLSVILGVATVTNALATSGGADIETDDALRIRIVQQLPLLGKGTKTAIEELAKTVAGIRYCKVIDCTDVLSPIDPDVYNTPGVAKALIVGTSALVAGQPPLSTVTTLLTAATNKTAGIKLLIAAATTVNLNLNITAQLTLTASASLSHVQALAQQNLMAFVNGGLDSFGTSYDGMMPGDTLYRFRIISLIGEIQGVQNIASSGITISYQVPDEQQTYLTGTSSYALATTTDSLTESQGGTTINAAILSVYDCSNSSGTACTQGSGYKKTYTQGVDYELTTSGSGPYTMHVHWLSGGGATHPSNNVKFYVTYRVLADGDIVTQQNQILYLNNVSLGSS